MLITTKHTKLRTILGARPKKLTVYLFDGDSGVAPSCSGGCATWPPVIGTSQVMGAATAAALETITRGDGTTQVTYRGHPLYFFVKDIKDCDPGDTYGEAIKAFGAEWYVLAPSDKKIDTS